LIRSIYGGGAWASAAQLGSRWPHFTFLITQLRTNTYTHTHTHVMTPL